MKMSLPVYLFCLLTSFGITLGLTPWVAQTAERIGLVDRPDGNLKVHGSPVPYMGGVSVFLGFLIGLSIFIRYDQEVLAVLLGGTLILILGLLDDMGGLPPRVKLLGQSLAILVALKGGVAIKIAFLPPVVAYLLSFLWLLGLTNGFNLIDIMDGLCSGTGAIACLFLFILSYSAGQGGVALMTIALMGALIGFLRHNYRPARIYLGDAGSLFLGYMLGALSMIGIYARVNPVALLAPILILGVPIFDTLFVTIMRWQRGVPVMWGSVDHFPLRLRKWRLSVAATVNVSYLASFALGTAALIMVFGTETAALVTLGAISLLLLGLALWLKRIDMNL